VTRGSVLQAPLQIETSRLILSAPSAEDAVSIFERYASDPDVTRYLGWPRHQSIADTEAFLKFSAAEWEQRPAGPYVIRARSDGRLLGGTGLGFEGVDTSLAVTGYVLAKDAWGKGYATEALRAMIDVAQQIEVGRLYALCHTEHRASWRVLEKCGFARDAGWSRQAEFPNLAPGVRQDVVCYALTLPRISGHAD
jgi:[ribosomal protein S5]-alanine N-acetyltransferase